MYFKLATERLRYRLWPASPAMWPVARRRSAGSIIGSISLRESVQCAASNNF